MNYLRSLGRFPRSFLTRSTFSIAQLAPQVQVQVAVRTIRTMTNPRDPNTLSNYNHWRSTHITANFDILFDQKKLVGNVIHKLTSKTDAESCDIILDTSHLDIGAVKVDGQPTKWELLPLQRPYGSPLRISLEKGVKLNGTVEVDV